MNKCNLGGPKALLQEGGEGWRGGAPRLLLRTDLGAHGADGLVKELEAVKDCVLPKAERGGVLDGQAYDLRDKVE